MKLTDELQTKVLTDILPLFEGNCDSCNKLLVNTAVVVIPAFCIDKDKDVERIFFLYQCIECFNKVKKGIE